MPETDWSDPCAALATLRGTYYELLSGSSVSRIRIENREVQFDSTSITVLRTEMSRLEAACALQLGRTGNRRAITFGAPKP